jgi:hypothetical protein
MFLPPLFILLVALIESRSLVHSLLSRPTQLGPRASDIQLAKSARKTRGNRTRLKTRDVAVSRYEARIYIRDLFKSRLTPPTKVYQELE